jgi:two-component system, cell cycle response regulator
MATGGTLYEDRGKKLKSSGIDFDRAVLVVLSPEQIGTTVLLDNPETIIGRSGGCDLVLDDPRVSGEHSLITASREDGFMIDDLDSTNGTYVNNRRIKKREVLSYGDRIVIGDTILRFFLEERLN